MHFSGVVHTSRGAPPHPRPFARSHLGFRTPRVDTTPGGCRPFATVGSCPPFDLQYWSAILGSFNTRTGCFDAVILGRSTQRFFFYTAPPFPMRYFTFVSFDGFGLNVIEYCNDGLYRRRPSRKWSSCMYTRHLSTSGCERFRFVLDSVLALRNLGWNRDNDGRTWPRPATSFGRFSVTGLLSALPLSVTVVGQLRWAHRSKRSVHCRRQSS